MDGGVYPRLPFFGRVCTLAMCICIFVHCKRGQEIDNGVVYAITVLMDSAMILSS
jgi:hypothetical protein